MMNLCNCISVYGPNKYKKELGVSMMNLKGIIKEYIGNNNV